VSLCCFKAIVLNYVQTDWLNWEGQIKLIEDINSVPCLLLLLCQEKTIYFSLKTNILIMSCGALNFNKLITFLRHEVPPVEIN